MNKWRIFCFWTVGMDRGKQTDPPRVVHTWLLLSSVCPHISMCPPRWHRCWQLLTKSQNLSSKSSDILKTFFVLPCGHMTLQVFATLPPNDYRGYCSVSINAQKTSCICFCLQIYGRAHRAFIVSGCWRWLCCMSAWFPCCVCINSSWKEKLRSRSADTFCVFAVWSRIYTPVWSAACSVSPARDWDSRLLSALKSFRSFRSNWTGHMRQRCIKCFHKCTLRKEGREKN